MQPVLPKEPEHTPAIAHIIEQFVMLLLERDEITNDVVVENMYYIQESRGRKEDCCSPYFSK